MGMMDRTPMPDDAATRPCCHGCGGEILPGEPRWAGDPEDRSWHYECADRAKLTAVHRAAIWFTAAKPR